MSVATLPEYTVGTAWKALVTKTGAVGDACVIWSVDAGGAPDHAAAMAILGLGADDVTVRIAGGADVAAPTSADPDRYGDIRFWLRSACKFG